MVGPVDKGNAGQHAAQRSRGSGQSCGQWRSGRKYNGDEGSMKTEKLLVYLGIAIVVYMLWSKQQTAQKAAIASAAGNSTAGIIGASVGGLSTILSSLPSGGGDDYSDDYSDDY
jgi:hypothetical protein